MVPSRGTQHGKCLHHSIFSTKHDQGLWRKLSPRAAQTFSAVTNTLAASLSLFCCVCESVFSYAYRWSWCEKASPITVLLSGVSAAHSGCGSVTICPLRPIFHFKNTKFPRIENTWLEKTKAYLIPYLHIVRHLF